MLDQDDPLNEGVAEETPKAKARQRQPKRAEGPFTRVPMCLIERAYPFDAKSRLFLAMWNASREGHHEFTLSANIWQPAGMSKTLKSRILREFEAVGIIDVERNGNRAPVIRFRDQLK
jgi:hypothetical protein